MLAAHESRQSHVLQLFLTTSLISRLVRANDLFSTPLDTSIESLCIPAVSCSLSNVPDDQLDGCCINSPSGHFLQTQFWDTSPALGANDTWTLHGLWPDFCKGGFDAYCDKSRSRSTSDIADIIARASNPDDVGTYPNLIGFMNRIWLSMNGDNAHLWTHEWNKHGTCISTIEPSCYDRRRPYAESSASNLKSNVSSRVDNDEDVLDYFVHAVMLYTTRPTFEYFAIHDILPSTDKTYTMEQLQSAIRDSAHGFEATIKCRNGNELSEIWYHFNARGVLRNAKSLWQGNTQWRSWVPTQHDGQQSNCPKTGIRYLPKQHNHKPGTTTMHTRTATHTATASATSTHHPTSAPFVGKGRLMVKVLNSHEVLDSDSRLNSQFSISDNSAAVEPLPSQYSGCLIRKGTWYMAKSLASCATFTARDDVRSILNTSQNEDDEDYHLFTIASRLAPCSFVPEDIDEETTSHPKAFIEVQQPDSVVPLLPSFFVCDRDLPFQSILSNNATIDPKHSETAKRLAIGTRHQTVFFAEDVPASTSQQLIYTDDDNGSREVKLEIYWEAL